MSYITLGRQNSELIRLHYTDHGTGTGTGTGTGAGALGQGAQALDPRQGGQRSPAGLRHRLTYLGVSSSIRTRSQH